MVKRIGTINRKKINRRENDFDNGRARAKYGSSRRRLYNFKSLWFVVVSSFRQISEMSADNHKRVVIRACGPKRKTVPVNV